MGTVLELRYWRSSDWTSLERRQLQALGERISPESRDIAFGVTDAGDPWCAIMDATGEVVLHIARIRGRVVIQTTRDGGVSEAGDLWTAAESVMASQIGDTLPDHIFAAVELSDDASTGLAGAVARPVAEGFHVIAPEADAAFLAGPAPLPAAYEAPNAWMSNPADLRFDAAPAALHALSADLPAPAVLAEPALAQVQPDAMTAWSAEALPAAETPVQVEIAPPPADDSWRPAATAEARGFGNVIPFNPTGEGRVLAGGAGGAPPEGPGLPGAAAGAHGGGEIGGGVSGGSEVGAGSGNITGAGGQAQFRPAAGIEVHSDASSAETSAPAISAEPTPHALDTLFSTFSVAAVVVGHAALSGDDAHASAHEAFVPPIALPDMGHADLWV